MKYPTQKEKKFSLVCQFCKGDFKGATSKTLTCSQRCSMALCRKNNAKPKVVGFCQQCTNPFTPLRSNARFCSSQCREKSYVTPKKVTSLKVCKCCGSKFRSNRTYCSKECFRLRNPDPEYQAINNVLSLRWELLARVSPPEFKKLMYKIERRLPL